MKRVNEPESEDRSGVDDDILLGRFNILNNRGLLGYRVYGITLYLPTIATRDFRFRFFRNVFIEHFSFSRVSGRRSGFCR